ncbi:MarR family winged helix-turn-helix transcriptional regulator [Kitasatospora sp. NPDC056651]|uniref:MarR family winged helix-turn-helix transcriptional regulator n=1 Tax=Kitasatospora sp. NPDC056651 TaxID=3345892 RepID=UPI0036BECABF
MDVLRLHRLARQLREVALKASRGGEDSPISVGDLAVLENVARYPDSSIGEISQRAGLAQSRVSKIVQDLVEAGVFQANKDAKDRRQTRVRLHPDAHQKTFEDYGKRPVDSALSETFPHLDDAGQARATELLNELADLLDTSTDA